MQAASSQWHQTMLPKQQWIPQPCCSNKAHRHKAVMLQGTSSSTQTFPGVCAVRQAVQQQYACQTAVQPALTRLAIRHGPHRTQRRGGCRPAPCAPMQTETLAREARHAQAAVHSLVRPWTTPTQQRLQQLLLQQQQQARLHSCTCISPSYNQTCRHSELEGLLLLLCRACIRLGRYLALLRSRVPRHHV